VHAVNATSLYKCTRVCVHAINTTSALVCVHAVNATSLYKCTRVCVHAVNADCQYGEDVRSIWLAEYVRWCQAFADYNTRYKKWTCMKVTAYLRLRNILTYLLTYLK